MTLEEYEYTSPTPEVRTELVAGRLLVRDSPKQRHGQIVVRVIGALIRYLDRTFATEAEAGLLLSNDTGLLIRCHPPTVRGPDVAYYVAERSPADTGRYSAVPPDLVVEVRSPTDRAGYLREKIDDWKSAGCRRIWVVDPGQRTFTVMHHEQTKTFEVGDVFEGAPLFPGLDLSITTLFR